MSEPYKGEVTRRAVLRDGSIAAVAVLAGSAFGGSDLAVAVGSRRYGFLREAELRTLGAAVDRFVPADDVPGALAAGCTEAIDALLGAFDHKPARIYSGAPFSDRGGSKVNHFDDFLPLDRYERKAWRLKILGSRGNPSLEFNGPVTGWQQIYREGITALDAAAGGGPGSFAAESPGGRDSILDSADAKIAELVDLAYPQTLQFMYGAPEYGGNKDLIGWSYTRYEGDVQPRGFTRAEIERPYPDDDDGSLLRGDPLLEAGALALAPMAMPDMAAEILGPGDPRLSEWRRRIRPILEWSGVELPDGR